jgi:hypothetical protein
MKGRETPCNVTPSTETHSVLPRWARMLRDRDLRLYGREEKSMDRNSLLSSGEQPRQPGVSTVLTLSSEQRFEALRIRFEDQARLLATMTDLDLRIFGGYISIQLALGGWLGQHAPTKIGVAIGIAIIDLAMAAIAGVMLRYNAVYRTEVVTNIKNALDAFEFTRPGAYLKGRTLNSMGPTRRWAPLFYVGVLAGYIGLLLVIFSKR